MRNQKVAAPPTRIPNPANKLRRDAPQVQAPVQPKRAGQQMQVNRGVDALKAMFKKRSTAMKGKK
jgi:hypothetical protein